jgi:hypothetical protein
MHSCDGLWQAMRPGAITFNPQEKLAMETPILSLPKEI